MAKTSSQKFIARNRAPRVQIEYDVEVYGAEKKIQLPFVMGVMADLSGKPAEALPGVADRKALEIDVDNFDERLKSMKPRVAFRVPNTLTGEGNLSIDLTFESMDDFSPAAVARKVDALSQLLDARTQMSNLLTYMDGKAGAEELIAHPKRWKPAVLKCRSLISVCFWTGLKSSWRSARTTPTFAMISPASGPFTSALQHRRLPARKIQKRGSRRLFPNVQTRFAHSQRE